MTPHHEPDHSRKRGRLSRHIRWIAVLCALAACTRPNPPRSAEDSGELAQEVLVEGDRMSYRLRLAPLSNLIYQLDCIAGIIHCARAIFRPHWDRNPSASDRELLSRWKQLRQRHSGTIKVVSPRSAPAQLLGPSRSYDLQERQRLVGFRASTPEAYRAGLALVSADAEARELGEILRQFAPRFEVWWRDQGFEAGREFMDRFQPLLADPFFDEIFARAVRFYEADIPQGTVFTIHLVVQPRSERRLVAAYQLEGDGIVEVQFGGDPKVTIGVLAHELAHYLFFRMAPEARTRLLDHVVSSEDPYAAASYGMLDEAVAAALGNGVVARHYLPPRAYARQVERGLIHYRAAGRVALELLPLLDEHVASDSTMSSDRFMSAYYEAARRSYPTGAPRPIDYLHSPILVVDSRFADAGSALRGHAWAGFPYLREFASSDADATAFVADHPYVSVAYLVEPEEASRDPARRLPPHLRGTVTARRRTDRSHEFVFVARDAESMRELVDGFASLERMKQGALLALPMPGEADTR